MVTKPDGASGRALGNGDPAGWGKGTETPCRTPSPPYHPWLVPAIDCAHLTAGEPHTEVHDQHPGAACQRMKGRE